MGIENSGYTPQEAINNEKEPIITETLERAIKEIENLPPDQRKIMYETLLDKLYPGTEVPQAEWSENHQSKVE